MLLIKEIKTKRGPSALANDPWEWTWPTDS